MNWTTEIPTKYGYYWWRLDPACKPEPVVVYEEGTFSRTGDSKLFNCEFEGGEWAWIEGQ